MSGFVEECRREWRRLGVPDPIANEMAIDLTADIEEAEAEGGSAEDVLGNSLFDPRRFAAAWACARGVTAPLTPIDPFASLVQARRAWYRPAVVIALTLFGFLTVLAAAALVIGRHGVAVAAQIPRNIGLPGTPRSFGPVSVHSLPYFVSGTSFSVQSAAPVLVLACVMFMVGIGALGLVFFYRTSWPRDFKRRLR